MSPTIHVDDEVLAELGARATPFVDTEPNHVLRRILGLEQATAGAGGPMMTSAPRADEVSEEAAQAVHTRAGKARPKKGSKSRTRAKKGTLLDETAYWMPILRALDEHGGKGAASEIVIRVGELIDDQLLPADREMLETGGIRWQARAHFARLRMKEEGLVVKDSPRGVWEITEKGRQHLLAGNTAAV